jgi:hypothetical protein
MSEQSPKQPDASSQAAHVFNEHLFDFDGEMIFDLPLERGFLFLQGRLGSLQYATGLKSFLFGSIPSRLKLRPRLCRLRFESFLGSNLLENLLLPSLHLIGGRVLRETKIGKDVLH